MKNKFANRINSDSAESLTVAQILWIVFTVVLVVYVGTLIYNAISKKGDAVSKCIEDSNNIFAGADQKCKDFSGK